MSIPKITVTETRTPSIPDDGYSHLPPPQEGNGLKISPTSSTCSAFEENEEDSGKDFDPSIGAKPYSPFYRHYNAPATVVSPHDVGEDQTLNFGDVELGQQGHSKHHDERTPIPRFPLLKLVSGRGNRRHSRLWAEDRRGKNCLSGLSKKQRVAVKLVIALVILGGMIGIALGISVAVGGGVWAGGHRVNPIGKGSHSK